MPRSPILGRIQINRGARIGQRQQGDARGLFGQNGLGTLVAAQLRQLWQEIGGEKHGVTGDPRRACGLQYCCWCMRAERDHQIKILRRDLWHIGQNDEHRPLEPRNTGPD